MDRNGLEGEESHADRHATVWRCLSNRERGREKERWSRDHLRVTLAPSAILLLFLLIGRGFSIQPKPLTKMSRVHLEESRQCLRNGQAECVSAFYVVKHNTGNLSGR